MTTEPDGKRIVLTEEQAALLVRAVLDYNRNLRRLDSDYPLGRTDREHAAHWQKRRAGGELAYLLQGEDYEYQRITVEWSNVPFPDVALRPEESE